MNRLINVKDFLDILSKDEKVVILDCRFDLMDKKYGVNSYAKGHIEGAYLLDLETALVDPLGEHGGRHPFRNHDELRKELQSYGIDDDTTVIAYDDGDMQGAGRLVYQLNNLGHYKAFALDGGITAYKKHGGKIQTDINKPTPSKNTLSNKSDWSFIVDMDYVKSKLYDENTIIIDSRSNPRYLGLEEPVDKKAGHIPSAQNYFFMDVLNLDNIDDSSFKTEGEIKKHFEKLDPNKEIIVYCGSGISLMVNALALDKAGINYKIYPGSFSDWISYDDNKVATGHEK